LHVGDPAADESAADEGESVMTGEPPSTASSSASSSSTPPRMMSRLLMTRASRTLICRRVHLRAAHAPR